jgi:hypothetical protein
MYQSLHRQCQDETTKRRDLESAARFSFGERKLRLQKLIESFHSPACEAFQKYFSAYT